MEMGGGTKMIKLGDKVRDRTTGFTGIVVARTDWLYGCTRFGVRSQELEDGKPIPEEWFDEQALDSLSKELGGPCPGDAETG